MKTTPSCVADLVFRARAADFLPWRTNGEGPPAASPAGAGGRLAPTALLGQRMARGSCAAEPGGHGAVLRAAKRSPRRGLSAWPTRECGDFRP
jgi:hypothetical protein